MAVSGPLWARWVFALAFAGIGLHCALRLLGNRFPALAADRGRDGRDPWGDLAHLIMSAGMVVMFLPAPTPIPPAWWAVLFGVQAVWFAVRLVRGGRPVGFPGGGHPATCTTHLISSVVMAGMFAVLPPDGLSGAAVSHAGHLGASGYLAAAAGWAALVYFLAQSLVCGVRVAAAHPERTASTAHAGGELAVRLLMGFGTSYMLLTML